jgi:uncharacterized protein (DUF433 family)
MPSPAPAQTRWLYLERDPLSSYKQLSIKGRRIKARTVWGALGSDPELQTVEQVAQNYGIPVEAVNEAVAYCESNPPELLQDYAYDEALMEASGMNDPNYKYNPKPKPISPEEIMRIRREVYGDE